MKTLLQTILENFREVKKLSWWQIARLSTSLSYKEWLAVLGLTGAILISSLSLAIISYVKNTSPAATEGGSYIEGLLGEPQFLNPLLSVSNDVDRDISQLVFSGLLKYDKNGQLIPDLAESYGIGEEGKVYDFFLRNGVRWHDGKPFTADDVVFTINLAQNQEIKSPIRPNWLGVKAEKIDGLQVRFILQSPYVPFLENTTLGILPKHAWESVAPSNFSLVDKNLKPVGTGPFKFQALIKNAKNFPAEIHLKRFKNYHLENAKIDRIIFRFFEKEEDAVKAITKKEIEGIGSLSSINKDKIKNFKNLNLFELHLPRYFAVFFNQQKSKILQDKSVREALAYAIDKNELTKKVLQDIAEPVEGPVLPEYPGYDENFKIYKFDAESARRILEKQGWKDLNGDGLREKKSKKEETKLKIELSFPQVKEIKEVVNFLKEAWQKVGFEIILKEVPIEQIQEAAIRPRDFEALIFGEILGNDPDPFSFWHSSQKRDPGLNLAQYDSKEVDNLLETARITSNVKERTRKYSAFQKIIAQDLPAIFLYRPLYLFAMDNKIKGAEFKRGVLPSHRFSEVNTWYIKTKRKAKNK